MFWELYDMDNIEYFKCYIYIGFNSIKKSITYIQKSVFFVGTYFFTVLCKYVTVNKYCNKILHSNEQFL